MHPIQLVHKQSIIMPRTINFEPHFDAITSKYGQELDADMVKEYVANNPDVSYQTVTKYLNKWKISRGKWLSLIHI